MQSTEYLHLTVAALYQLRDSMVAAQGYLEIANLTTPKTLQTPLHQCNDALARANRLLTALEAYRVNMNAEQQLSSVRLDQYLRNIMQNAAPQPRMSYQFSRIYRLPSVSASPQLLEHIFNLVTEFFAGLNCATVQIIPKARPDVIQIRFLAHDCKHAINTSLINKKVFKISDISQLDHITLVAVTAKLLAEKMGASLTLTPTKLTLHIPRARQLSLGVGS